MEALSARRGENAERDALRAELAAEREWQATYKSYLSSAEADVDNLRKLLREEYKVVSMSRMHDGLRHRMSALLERHDDE